MAQSKRVLKKKLIEEAELDAVAVPETVFVVSDLNDAYELLTKLLTINMRNTVNFFPREINFAFYYNNLPESELQLNLLNKLLELLTFDHYYYNKNSIPVVNIELSYSLPPSPILNRNILKRIESLTTKIHRISVINHFSPLRCRSTIATSDTRGTVAASNDIHYTLNPQRFRNISVLRMISNGFTGSFNQDLRNATPHLKTLDIRSNDITSIVDCTLPLTLCELYVLSNRISSLEGPDYDMLTSLTLIEASINALNSIQKGLPRSLKVLKLDYNSITNLGDQFDELINLEVILLLNNFGLNNFEDVTFPPCLKEIYLDGNNIKGLPDTVFLPLPHIHLLLEILSLKGNAIDDLDDLGKLPTSLVSLLLDNNQIDHQRWSQFYDLVNLTELSLSGCGILDVQGLLTLVIGGYFPDNFASFKKLDLSLNDIDRLLLQHLSLFSLDLEELNLNDNHLREFHIFEHDARSLRKLDLSYNPLNSINLDYMTNLKELSLAGVWMKGFQIDSGNLSRFPPSLEILDLSNTSAYGLKPYVLDARALSMLPRLKSLSLQHNLIEGLGPGTIFPHFLKSLCIDIHVIQSLPEIERKNFIPIGGNYLLVRSSIPSKEKETWQTYFVNPEQRSTWIAPDYNSDEEYYRAEGDY